LLLKGRRRDPQAPHSEIALDRDGAVRYAQQWANTGFLDNVMKLWTPFGIVGADAAIFSASGNNPLTRHRAQDQRKGKTAA
jgi:hypothetical protein